MLSTIWNKGFERVAGKWGAGGKGRGGYIL